MNIYIFSIDFKEGEVNFYYKYFQDSFLLPHFDKWAFLHLSYYFAMLTYENLRYP